MVSCRIIKRVGILAVLAYFGTSLGIARDSSLGIAIMPREYFVNQQLIDYINEPPLETRNTGKSILELVNP